MSTIKSSAENLTLNADGANNDIKFQSNGSEVAAIDQAGNLTVSGTVDGVDIQTLNTTVNSKAPIADPTFTGTVASIISANNAQGEIAFGDPEDANIGRIAYNHPSNFLATVVNATEYMRIHSNGVTSIPSGVALGVAVSANTASNVLDDYEEGSWTPAYTPTSGAALGSVTYVGSIPGRYTKIGNLVTVMGYIGTAGITVGSATASAGVGISGLPFTAASLGAGNWTVGCGGDKWGGEVPSMIESRSGAADLRLYYRASITANESAITVADMGTGSDSNYVRFQISYRV